MKNRQVAELLALRELEAGTCESTAWCELAEMCLTAIELARTGIGVELLPLADAAEAALVQVASGPRPMRMLPEGVQALRDLQAAHDEQRRIATKGELMRARTLALERLGQSGA